MALGTIFLFALVAGALVVLIIMGLRFLDSRADSSRGNWESRPISQATRKLRSYDMRTLEPQTKTTGKPPVTRPEPKDDTRFMPRVHVSPSPIIAREKVETQRDRTDQGQARHKEPSRQPATPPASAAPFPPRQPEARALSTAEMIEKLRAIDWFQFEKVVSLLYYKQGYIVTRRGGANPDGGIDFVIEKAGLRKAVQCKQWKTWNVGVKPVREFFGALQSAQILHGVFVTLRGYTEPARELAEKHGIEMLDQDQLARKLSAVGAQSDPEVMELLMDTRKFCPKCESEMILRTTRNGANAGDHFWGCSTYPRCRFQMKLA